MVERNVFGLPVTIAMIRHHPVIQLTPSEEFEFVKLSDENALKQFFADVASPDDESQFRAAQTVREKLGIK